jgi:hypothetical protein
MAVMERVARHREEGTLPPVPWRPSKALSCAALLFAFAVGCGADQEGETASDEQQVRAVVARYAIATRKHDYQTICDTLLARVLVRRVEDLGLPCESALQRGFADVRDPRLEIRDVSVGAGRALVSVHSTAQGEQPADVAVQLVQENGEWRIAALAEPQGSGTTPGATAAPASTATPSSGATPSSAAPSATTVPTPDHDDRDDAARAKTTTNPR